MLFETVNEIQYYKTIVDRFVVTIRPPYKGEYDLETETFWTLNVSNYRNAEYWKHTHDVMGKEINSKDNDQYFNGHFNGFSTKEEAFEFAEKYVNFLTDTLPF